MKELTLTRPSSPPRPPDSVAYTLFREFSEKVVAAGIPKPEIRSEADLVADLYKELDAALRAVQRKPERHDNFEYLIGFGTGFVLGALQVKWYADYVLPHDYRYKAKVAIDAVLALTEFDAVLAARLQALYTAHFDVKDRLTDATDDDSLRLRNASPELIAYPAPSTNGKTLPNSNHATGALERVRADLIFATAANKKMYEPFAIDDEYEVLIDFIAKWVNYAVNGVMITG